MLGGTSLDALEDTAALPEEVLHALRQWAWMAGRVSDEPAPAEDAVAVTRRGQQLAALLAAVCGEPVEYVDPISGITRPVGPEPVVAGPEPIPWSTGLTVSGFIAVLMALLDLVLTSALRIEYGWIWIPANVLVGIGLAPTILLLRKIPFWRWIAYGISAGLAFAWAGLLISAIFSHL